MPKIITMLDVSTAHLTADERHLLAANALPTQCFGHVDSAAGILSTDGFGRQSDPDTRPHGVSDTLAAILRLAADLGGGYVLFDRDADGLPGYPTFAGGA